MLWEFLLTFAFVGYDLLTAASYLLAIALADTPRRTIC
jgi:hypothetical protein